MKMVVAEDAFRESLAVLAVVVTTVRPGDDCLYLLRVAVVAAVAAFAVMMLTG